MMIHLKHEWEIVVTPLLPPDCVWLSIMAPYIGELWHHWQAEVGEDFGDEGDELLCFSDGEEEEEETSMARPSDLTERDDESDSDNDSESEEKEDLFERVNMAGYYRAASKMWIHALERFQCYTEMYKAKDLRARYDCLECQRDMLCRYPFQWQHPQPQPQAQQEAEQLRQLQHRSDVTEQLFALQNEIDALCSEVTENLQLNKLLFRGRVYEANAYLPQCVYVIYL